MARVVTHPALRVTDANACVARFGYAPRVTGVPVLPPDVSEAAWLEARRPMLTASEVAVVLGRSPYDSPFSLWWRKQPDWPHPEQSLTMHIGRKLEAVIGELWAESNPDAALYRPGAALWAHHTHTWLGATPDYLAVFPGDGGVTVEPVECKSDEGGDDWGREGTDEVPFHHLCQVITQTLVLGADRGRVMRLSGKRKAEYVIELDNHGQLVADILEAGRSFVVGLEAGITPEVDGHTATGAALQDLYPAVDPDVSQPLPDELAEVFTQASDMVAAWQARKQEALNRIRALMGPARAKYGVTADGERVVTRSVFKRNGYTVPPAEIDMIRKAKKRA